MKKTKNKKWITYENQFGKVVSEDNNFILTIELTDNEIKNCDFEKIFSLMDKFQSKKIKASQTFDIDFVTQYETYNEIWSNIEIVTYFRKLIMERPYIFYFLNKETGTHDVFGKLKSEQCGT